MSSTIFRAAIITLITLITACSTAQYKLLPNTPISPGPIQAWSTKLESGPGEVEIQFILKPTSRADIVFIRPGISRNSITRITFNDLNCSTGHEASVTYNNKSAEFYTSYFEKKAPWGMVSTLKINWDKDYKLVINLNGETIHMTHENQFTALQINSYSQLMDIQKILHTQQ